MVHLYWDFVNVKELAELDPLKRTELAIALKKELDIPIGYKAGFDNPYIEILSNDPVINNPAFRPEMIPRPAYIKIVAVRHLTYQNNDFIDKIQEVAKKVLIN